MSATLICPCCRQATNVLWYFAWCEGCWYTVCGGDLALDWALAQSPSAFLTASAKEEK